MNELDGAKPFDTEKRERLRLVLQQRMESEPAAEAKRPEVREEKIRCLGGNREIFVCAWDSIKLRDGEMEQPWHERLIRIREGNDPRF